MAYVFSINDIGITIEIIGFFLFLIGAKILPKITAGMAREQDNEDEVKIQKCWKWTSPANFGQFSRIIAISLIIGGLILQLDSVITLIQP